MYIKLYPFPEWIKEKYKCSRYVKKMKEAYNNMYFKDFFTNNCERFNVKFFRCKYNDLFNEIFDICWSESMMNDRINPKIKFDGILRRKTRKITGAWNKNNTNYYPPW